MRLTNNDLIVVERQKHNHRVRATIHRSDPEHPREQALPHVVRHSPTEFEYGYGGSGPADLALSILTTCCGTDFADTFYQQFKFERIAPERSDRWSIKVQQVREWIEQKVNSSGETPAEFYRES